MRTSIQVCKLIGIPIKLHFSFLFIIPLFVYLFAKAPGPVGLGDIEELPFAYRFFLSVIAAFLFFVSLLLHEMSHSCVAMKYGTRIHSITLFIFGGLAMMEDIPKSPDKEWRIAIAGPLMSFALGGIFLLMYFGTTILNLNIYEPVKILLFSLGFLNVILGTFNLLPAFPMDGGRVLRAYLARRMSFLKATKRAVLVGKIFAVIMGIIGISPNPSVLSTEGYVMINPFLTMIAIFLYIAATEEETATVTFATLEGIKVKNVMRTERTSVQADMSIEELANKMLGEKTAEYAVLTESGEIKGFVTFDAIKNLSSEQRHFFRVSDVTSSFDSISDSISEEEAATEALKKMIRTKKDIMAVKEAMSEILVGIITKRDLLIYMEMLKGNA